jgi:hypothetical protein
VNSQAQRLLIEAKILPEALPQNYTFNKVREILRGLETADQGKLSEAVEAARSLKILGPLSTLIFIKHHLEGEHEAEVDRIDEGEEGARLAILVYPEGEVPIPAESLPAHIDVGVRLRYSPSERRYS